MDRYFDANRPRTDGPSDYYIDPRLLEGTQRHTENVAIGDRVEVAAPEDEVPNTAGNHFNNFYEDNSTEYDSFPDNTSFDVPQYPDLTAFNLPNNAFSNRVLSNPGLDDTGSENAGWNGTNRSNCDKTANTHDAQPVTFGEAFESLASLESKCFGTYFHTAVEKSAATDATNGCFDIDKFLMNDNRHYQTANGVTQTSEDLLGHYSAYANQNPVADGLSNAARAVAYQQPANNGMNGHLNAVPQLSGVSVSESDGSNPHIRRRMLASISSNITPSEATPAPAGPTQLCSPPQEIDRVFGNGLLRNAVSTSMKRKASDAGPSDPVLQSGSDAVADGSNAVDDGFNISAGPRAKKAKILKKPKAKAGQSKSRRGKGKGRQRVVVKEEEEGSESEVELGPEPQRIKVDDFWDSLKESKGIRPHIFPDIDELLNPTSDTAQTTTYSSAQEARAASEVVTDVRDDLTLPHTEAAKKAIVVALVDAMLNVEYAQDGAKAFKAWRKARVTPIMAERAAWELLEGLISRNTDGPALLSYEYQKWIYEPKWMTFKDRLSKIMEGLIYHKTMCKHIIDASYVKGLIEDPPGSVNRVRTNVTVNGKKAAIIAAGKKIMDKIDKKKAKSEQTEKTGDDETDVSAPVDKNDQYDADDEFTADENAMNENETQPTLPTSEAASPSPTMDQDFIPNQDDATSRVPAQNVTSDISAQDGLPFGDGNPFMGAPLCNPESLMIPNPGSTMAGTANEFLGNVPRGNHTLTHVSPYSQRTTFTASRNPGMARQDHMPRHNVQNQMIANQANARAYPYQRMAQHSTPSIDRQQNSTLRNMSDSINSNAEAQEQLNDYPLSDFGVDSPGIVNWDEFDLRWPEFDSIPQEAETAAEARSRKRKMDEADNEDDSHRSKRAR
ncbi:uncharacterized protein BO97DRAFT_411061 [Aspergillus homomorphus CBS 101889]|uniref:Uncharacterized protein n=1 Tax=Aspergillus homomorphus (strain CBS 101889) TaxID=1450537 RepID=A0A395I777_ASPHC|nr:hypothetical protein BO97DRAFT_411061 [Aspergillus homomorphus CBS 101889]RAL15756.1 hypothetical protein BO97DRAFT_411061 [Aspergillus homomorphus CBS 101889]